MGNIMRQPAGVMAEGLWLIELLPTLHTKQDLHLADELVGTQTVFLKMFTPLCSKDCTDHKEK